MHLSTARRAVNDALLSLAQPGPGSETPLAPPSDSSGAQTTAGWTKRIGRNVLFLGLTSLLTDVSSEMVTAVLPLYLTFVLHFTPLAFGFVDGLYQGTSALIRLWGGLIADRGDRRKEVAAAGYAASALCKLGLWLSGTLWLPTTVVLFVDRLSKGMRTPPRDALIALSSPRAHVAEAFGVHRAMDTAGALIGPLLAFAILARAPAAFDAIFMVSFVFAVLGVAALLLFVENRGGSIDTPAAVTWPSAIALLRSADFRALTLGATLLSLCTVSDSFVYLVIQRRVDLAPSLFPLLPVVVALAYLILAVPAGRVADGLGRSRILLLGYGALIAAYVLLAWANPSRPALLGSLLLVGGYYAATDGVLMAMTSRVVPADRLASGMALVTTGTVGARLLGSIVFGSAWSWFGPENAVRLFLFALGAAIAVAAVILPRGE